MNKLNGLKVALCQMAVVPGRPDINTAYIIKEIEAASRRGDDVLVFPELCVSGYVIADKFEDLWFVKDIQEFNKDIAGSVPDNLVVVFGTVVFDGQKGEDGRHRMHNAAVIAQGGKLLGYVVKTLQPHYRYFDDPKHFFSGRQVAEELAELYRKTNGKAGIENCSVHDLLKVFEIKTSIGVIPLGVSICEDIWKDDYVINPAGILADKGAKLIIAISASPWGWQKNRKRHQVIKDLIGGIKIPIIYVNNTGCQNNGDNIINFDGASTIYNDEGDIIYEVESYFSGTQTVIFGDDLQNK